MMAFVVFTPGLFNFQSKFKFMPRVFLSFCLFFYALVTQAQSDSAFLSPPSRPSFSYKKDFKSLVDSSQDISSSLYYPVLLTRFLANDSTLTNYETLALMIGFTENPKYKPLEDMEKENEIYEMTQNGQFVEALAKSLPYLNSHPLSLLLLRETSYAYGRLSRNYEKDQIFDTAIIYMDSSNYYMALNDKIMEAMIYSGKGRTPEAPIFALGLADGEHFIPNVGYKIENTDTEWNRNGDFLEKIKAADNLTAKDFYFVIQHAKQKIDDDKADELTAKKSKKDKKKEAEKKKEQEKKKEGGGAFKSEKPNKKSKGKRTSPVFEDVPSDSTSAVPQGGMEQKQHTPEPTTDSTGTENSSPATIPSRSNPSKPKEEEKNTSEAATPADKPGGR